jgi:hypothetical protein
LPYLLIRQKFVDYAQWRTAYDDMADTRAQSGLRTVALTRNKADMDEIVVLFEFDDLARVKEYIQGPGLAEAWRRGGVVPDSNQATFLEAADDVDG